MKQRLRLRRRTLVASLLAAPLLLLLAWGVRWITIDTVTSTATGMAIGTLGGLVTGAVAERFLGRARNGTELVFGLAATVLLGVVTVGYLYVIHIRGPMSSIGTVARAVEQIVTFVQFLLSQGAGILLGPSPQTGRSRA